MKRWRLDQPTPMERMRILDPSADASAVALTYKRAVELVPALQGTSIHASWAGYVDSTPDGVPGIGEMASLPGLVIAAGFSGHGFGIGPGAGHLIADIVSGVSPIVDPRPYHPDRFQTSAWGRWRTFELKLGRGVDLFHLFSLAHKLPEFLAIELRHARGAVTTGVGTGGDK